MKLEEHSPWFTSTHSTCALSHVQSSRLLCLLHAQNMCHIYNEHSSRCHSLHGLHSSPHGGVCESMGLRGESVSHITQVQQVPKYCHHVCTVQIISWHSVHLAQLLWSLSSRILIFVPSPMTSYDIAKLSASWFNFRQCPWEIGSARAERVG